MQYSHLFHASDFVFRLDHPLKRFKGQYPADVKPQGYEKLSHPLLNGYSFVPKAETASDAGVYHASMSSMEHVGPKSNDPMMAPLVKSESVTETGRKLGAL